METLAIGPDPEVGRWKDRLLAEVLEGRLLAEDKDNARRMLGEWRAEERANAGSM